MKLLSPAKINLFLQVTDKRPDGFHELFSLMCCVNLFDTIYLEFDQNDIQIESSHPQIPLDETNLAYKAAAVFFRGVGVADGLKIFIEKSIPVAAGLGGGSSNAASVLMGLNQHYGYPLSRNELMAMGLGLGADVPFFVFGKPAFASGIGEKLEAYSGTLPFHFVLVYPGFLVSTAEVFQNLNLGLTKCEKKIRKPFLTEFGSNSGLHLSNDLEIVTASKHPVITSIKEQLLAHGADGALMTGSGPTVFGLFSDFQTAERAKQALGENTAWDVFICDVYDRSYPDGE